MSFLFETFSVPLWFMIFTFACASPLWIKWYRWVYKKVKKSKIMEKESEVFEFDNAEEEISLFEKATNNWNDNTKHERKTKELKKSKREHDNNSNEQPYVKIVLKTLALNGEAGMLNQSIADTLEIKSNEIKSSLAYLEKNEFVEAVLGGSGTKYYLADRGRKYCSKHGYIKK